MEVEEAEAEEAETRLRLRRRRRRRQRRRRQLQLQLQLQPRLLLLLLPPRGCRLLPTGASSSAAGPRPSAEAPPRLRSPSMSSSKGSPISSPLRTPTAERGSRKTCEPFSSRPYPGNRNTSCSAFSSSTSGPVPLARGPSSEQLSSSWGERRGRKPPCCCRRRRRSSPSRGSSSARAPFTGGPPPCPSLLTEAPWTRLRSL